jgi:hypothetical protein
MGRGRPTSVAAGLVVAVLLAAAGAGQARSRHGGKIEVQRASAYGGVYLGKEKGYRIALLMPSDRVVAFYAYRYRLKGDLGSVEYHIYAVHNRGVLRHGVVRARFGSLGTVSLRFRPGGRVRRGRPEEGCEGGREITEYGRFVGHLSFRSEGNVLHVSSPEGGAQISRSPRLRCKKGWAQAPAPRSLRKYVAAPPLFPDQNSIALIYASARRHGRYVGVTATHMEESPPGADVQLQVLEARKGMAIGHGAYLVGGPGTLLTTLPGVHPATASLAPPPPFYGEAAYSEEAGTWTGTLGVNLAGVKLPLAGPGFHVHLCVTNPLKDKDGCEFFKTESPSDERPAARLARPAWLLR